MKKIPPYMFSHQSFSVIAFFLLITTLSVAGGTLAKLSEHSTLGLETKENVLAAPAPSGTVNPTFGVIAPCPSCDASSITQVPSGSVVIPSTGVQPSTIIENPNPTEPCTTGASIARDRKSKHKEHNGDVSGFMEALLRFFMELINLLLRLLGGGQITIPDISQPDNPDDPCAPSEVPSIAPTDGADPSTIPSANPLPSASASIIPSAILSQGAPTTNADPSDCSATAGETLGWGKAQYESSFTGTTLDPTWHAYGPEPGHNKKGTRTPDQIKVADGNVSINSDGKGMTGAMKWFPGQKYGRWEVCMKVTTGEQHYVLITWPDAEDFPVGGELDFFEETGGPTKNTFFLHCPTSAGGNCATGNANVDARQWHAYALEWTPTVIAGYVDGKEFFRNTNTSFSPPRPMNLSMQLDWFEKVTGPDAMVIDWTRQWPVTGSVPSTLGLKAGEPATGQPGTYPDRKPRPLSVTEMLP